MERSKYSQTHLFLIIALVIVVVFNTYTLATFNVGNDTLDNTVIEASLSGLSVTIIDPSEDCGPCVKATDMIGLLESQMTLLFDEKTTLSKDDAASIIEEYNIDRFPTIIITGQSDILEQIGMFEKTSDGYILRETPPPYIDSDGIIHGVVTSTSITHSSCTDCVDPSLLLDQLEQYGVFIDGTTTINAASDEAKTLIEKYSITTLPSVLLSSEAQEYPFIKDLWVQAGTIEEDGTAVLRNVPPPFYSLETSSVSGFVDITYITDTSCVECYDVSVHKGVLTNNFGVVFGEEKTVDISSTAGKALLKKYDISIVPTVILSPETRHYTGLVNQWDQVGTIEDDTMYVMRTINFLGGETYKDLESGTIKKVPLLES